MDGVGVSTGAGTSIGTGTGPTGATGAQGLWYGVGAIGEARQ